EHSVIMSHGLFPCCFTMSCGDSIVTKQRDSGLFFYVLNGTLVIVNLFYSSTILFHLLPTATEILTRFPPDAPIVNSLTDPLLQKTFLGIFVVFLIMLIWQMSWLKGQK
ncbi:MAG: hypothetical protein L3J22_11465, partial [Xanthomonadales bacterium]|nr:hypothetical protein [Xanthomonadales bacterium]